MRMQGEPLEAGLPVIESKPGHKTTEFWVLLLVNILPEIGAIDVGDTRLKGILHIVTVLGYILSRGIAKAGVGTVTTE